MDFEELTKKIKGIRIRAEREKFLLQCSYAKEHAVASIGDIVTDHIGSVRVEKINYFVDAVRDIPSCIYSGPEITKKGVLFKNGSTRSVYQVNLKKD